MSLYLCGDGFPYMVSAPLVGLNIVVTRPREQAAELMQQIERLGGNPLLFPLLKISAVQNNPELFDKISHVARADLIIFISPNAVKYGLRLLEQRQFPSSLKIATIGQGSAKALLDAGITNVIAPPERFDSEGLLAQPNLQNVAGWKVMIFRGDGGREVLGDTLKARGALVEYVTCYLREKADVDVNILLTALPQAIIVTSSEALGYLTEMLDSEQYDLVFGLPLFVSHAPIADVARRQGWRNIHQTESGDDGLVSGLVAWSQRRHQ